MTRSTRGRAGIALVWYLCVGFGIPLLDGALFHRAADADIVHVESADNPDCHRERCSLESPGAPQAPASPVRVADVRTTAAAIAAPTPVPALRDLRADRVLGPRAPPSHT